MNGRMNVWLDEWMNRPLKKEVHQSTVFILYWYEQTPYGHCIHCKYFADIWLTKQHTCTLIWGEWVCRGGGCHANIWKEWTFKEQLCFEARGKSRALALWVFHFQKYFSNFSSFTECKWVCLALRRVISSHLLFLDGLNYLLSHTEKAWHFTTLNILTFEGIWSCIRCHILGRTSVIPLTSPCLCEIQISFTSSAGFLSAVWADSSSRQLKITQNVTVRATYCFMVGADPCSQLPPTGVTWPSTLWEKLQACSCTHTVAFHGLHDWGGRILWWTRQEKSGIAATCQMSPVPSHIPLRFGVTLLFIFCSFHYQ